VKSVALDDVDHRIVSALVRNGRATFASLGEEVGLSPHGVADRVRRLQRAGIIVGYTALIDRETLGQRLDAIIDVRLSSSVAPETFEAQVAGLDAVREVAFVTGRFDYQVRVMCADADGLDRIVRVLRRDAGAAQTETRIVMRKTTMRGV
jgi:Lrp/AsnC family leucine-responsive transcriptional regulator